MLQTLKTTQEEFETLHEFVDGTRAIEISVPRSYLSNLIEDNEEMYAVLAKESAMDNRRNKGLVTPGGVPKAVYDALNGQKRANSKNVSIDKKLVINMLIDHSVLIGKLDC